MRPEQAVEKLRADLERVLGPRLLALVVYEGHGARGDLPGADEAAGGTQTPAAHARLVHTLVVAERLDAGDLARLAPLAADWDKAGLALPLFFGRQELARSLDAFPLEFAQILARYRVVLGDDPLAGMAVQKDDLRRACEAQVKSHLVHLREGYLQTAGKRSEVARLVTASTMPLRALLVNIARLHGVHPRSGDDLAVFLEQRLHVPAAELQPVLALADQRDTGGNAAALFPGYMQAMERLARLVDEWAL
jgi:hypothetical protein